MASVSGEKLTHLEIIMIIYRCEGPPTSSTVSIHGRRKREGAKPVPVVSVFITDSFGAGWSHRWSIEANDGPSGAEWWENARKSAKRNDGMAQEFP